MPKKRRSRSKRSEAARLGWETRRSKKAQHNATPTVIKQLAGLDARIAKVTKLSRKLTTKSDRAEAKRHLATLREMRRTATDLYSIAPTNLGSRLDTSQSSAESRPFGNSYSLLSFLIHRPDIVSLVAAKRLHIEGHKVHTRPLTKKEKADAHKLIPYEVDPDLLRKAIDLADDGGVMVKVILVYNKSVDGDDE